MQEAVILAVLHLPVLHKPDFLTGVCVMFPFNSQYWYLLTNTEMFL